MKTESIDLVKLNRVAKRAVNTLINAASHAGSGMDDFFEDQFVMEVGSVFRTSRSLSKGSLFPYLKFPYPNKKRTDILLEGSDASGVKHCIWIEAKFRKRLCESEWRKDLEKLRSPKKGEYGAVHHGYWIYLYIFETKCPEIIKQFGKDRKWKRRKADRMAEFFVCHDHHRKTGQNLREICKAFGNSNILCSIIPSLCLPNDSSGHTGLLVTAQAK